MNEHLLTGQKWVLFTYFVQFRAANFGIRYTHLHWNRFSVRMMHFKIFWRISPPSKRDG